MAFEGQKLNTDNQIKSNNLFLHQLNNENNGTMSA
jgi:hypothetical protein